MFLRQKAIFWGARFRRGARQAPSARPHCHLPAPGPRTGEQNKRSKILHKKGKWGYPRCFERCPEKTQLSLHGWPGGVFCWTLSITRLGDCTQRREPSTRLRPAAPTLGSAKRRLPKNHSQLSANRAGGRIYFFETIIDLQLQGGHPFHVSPSPLRTVSQVPSLMELDHLGNRQFHMSCFNSSAVTHSALPMPWLPDTPVKPAGS